MFATGNFVKIVVMMRTLQAAALAFFFVPISTVTYQTLPRLLVDDGKAATDCATEFLTVLDAERSLLQAEQQNAASTTSVSLDLVQPFKALGGGWETAFPDLPSETAAVPVPLNQSSQCRNSVGSGFSLDHDLITLIEHDLFVELAHPLRIWLGCGGAGRQGVYRSLLRLILGMSWGLPLGGLILPCRRHIAKVSPRLRRNWASGAVADEIGLRGMGYL